MTPFHRNPYAPLKLLQHQGMLILLIIWLAALFLRNSHTKEKRNSCPSWSTTNGKNHCCTNNVRTKSSEDVYLKTKWGVSFIIAMIKRLMEISDVQKWQQMYFSVDSIGLHYLEMLMLLRNHVMLANEVEHIKEKWDVTQQHPQSRIIWCLVNRFHWTLPTLLY